MRHDRAWAVLHGIKTILMIAGPKVGWLKFTQKTDPSVEVFPDGCRPIRCVGIPHGSGPESRQIHGVA